MLDTARISPWRVPLKVITNLTRARTQYEKETTQSYIIGQYCLRSDKVCLCC